MDDDAADALFWLPGAGVPFGRGAVVAAAADMVGNCRRWRGEAESIGAERCYLGRS